MAEPLEITALTLNCWGLKYISALRAERIPEIGRRIAELATPLSSSSPSSPPPLSIVGLQECWVYDDFATIHSLTRHVLPYAKFFYGGVWGAGLAVLSRWPITQSSMYTYPLCGRPTAFWRGDWYVGKGIASATIQVTDTTTVEVLVTHTHAPYESRLPNDSYLVHQLSETWEMGKRARAAAERGRLVLAMGDYNMTPDSLMYNALHLGAGAGSGAGSGPPILRDTWRELHPDSSLGPADHPAEKARSRPVPAAVFNLHENGTTSDNVYNTWRWPKDKQTRLHKAYAQRAQAASKEDAALGEFRVDPDMADPRGKRLDYIFYAPPQTPGPAWKTTAARVAMVEPHPTAGCSVSDHFAYMTTLASQPLGVGPDSPSTLPTVDGASNYDRFIAELEKYMLREQKQRYWRGVHFFGAVAVAIGCYVAVWFSPRPFVAFLLTFLASLGLAAGVVDGLLSLLFFNSEIRHLKEFRWEISNARSLLNSQRPPPSSSSTQGLEAHANDNPAGSFS